MIRLIALDAGPLSLVTQRHGIQEADQCRRWIATCVAKGIHVVAPEIADYEVRRELRRASKSAGLARLDAFIAAAPDRYLPITTVAMRLAADLWAQMRQAGTPTADPHALDGDVILAAQVLTIGLPTTELVVATTNVRHLDRLLPAQLWSNISP